MSYVFDFAQGFLLVVFACSAFLSGVAATDKSSNGAHTARCVFYPISVFLFLVLFAMGVRT